MQRLVVLGTHVANTGAAGDDGGGNLLVSSEWQVGGVDHALAVRVAHGLKDFAELVNLEGLSVDEIPYTIDHPSGSGVHLQYQLGHVDGVEVVRDHLLKKSVPCRLEQRHMHRLVHRAIDRLQN